MKDCTPDDTNALDGRKTRLVFPVPLCVNLCANEFGQEYFIGANCHLGWHTLVLKCNKNNHD
jgi:hypothetical protein